MPRTSVELDGQHIALFAAREVRGGFADGSYGAMGKVAA